MGDHRPAAARKRNGGGAVTARAAFKQDDVRRAIGGVKAAGFNVARVEIEDGRIVVVIGEPGRERRNPLDKLYG